MPKKIDIAALPIGLTRIDTGLYIRKRPAPRKPIWLCVYRWGGRRRETSLGSYPEVGIVAARQKADRIRAKIDAGIDPIQEKKDLRRAQAQAHDESVYTFARLVEDALPVIEEAKHWRNPKSAAQWRATIDAYAVPVLGKRPLQEITRDDILAVLKPIWKTKTETAKRLRGRLEALFSYGIVSGRYSGTNPCMWRGGLALFLPSPEKVRQAEHQEALSLEETKALFESLDFEHLPVGWAAIVFGVLVAARCNEFVKARWDEIDFESRTWLCPRRKDGKSYPHRAPLSAQAISILQALPRDSAFVFASKKSPDNPLSTETPRVLIKKKLGHGTMHGFRSTFRDWAAERSIDRVLAEKCLMHTTGTEVERAYQRSDLLEQRRPVMQAWADAILPMRLLERAP
nr:MAG TPA: Integrase [Bacteriophage sp.]